MVETVDCGTCGGSGRTKKRCGDPPTHPCSGFITKLCPDCIRGRQPTPEVIERMTEGLFNRLAPISIGQTWEWYQDAARALWLAEHKENV